MLSEPVMRFGLAFFAASQLLLGLWMVVDPGSFFEQVGGFGAQNDHYIRDVATWNVALGVTAGIAVVRESWRVPVLVFTVIQFVLHTINHLVDVNEAVADTSGWFDVISLAVGLVLLAGLLRTAAAREAA
jgi:hypothetical protein